MPFSVKHIFQNNEIMVARKFQENWDDIVRELNSFPINGAFKPGSIAANQLTADCVTASKFKSNLQFNQIPKVTSYAINTANHTTHTLVHNGADVTSIFTVGTYFRIHSSSANDGVHQVNSRTYAGGNTSIVIDDDYPLVDSTGDGYMQLVPDGDQLCSKAHVYNNLLGLITGPATGSKGAGVSTFSASTASHQEYEKFFNWFRVVYGYCAKADLTKVGTNLCYALPWCTGFYRVFHAMVMPIGSGLTTQAINIGATDTTASNSVKYVSYSSGDGHRIWITPAEEIAGDNWWGVFYMLIGKTNS